MLRHFLLCALAGFATSAAFAQAVHVVDPSGSGDFTTIAAAYNSANSGDVLLVAGGTYPGATLNRGITIVI